MHVYILFMYVYTHVSVYKHIQSSVCVYIHTDICVLYVHTHADTYGSIYMHRYKGLYLSTDDWEGGGKTDLTGQSCQGFLFFVCLGFLLSLSVPGTEEDFQTGVKKNTQPSQGQENRNENACVRNKRGRTFLSGV